MGKIKTAVDLCYSSAYHPALCGVLSNSDFRYVDKTCLRALTPDIQTDITIYEFMSVYKVCFLDFPTYEIRKHAIIDIINKAKHMSLLKASFRLHIKYVVRIFPNEVYKLLRQ